MIPQMTVSYMFTDEEIEDIHEAAKEHHISVEELIRQAVLDKIAA